LPEVNSIWEKVNSLWHGGNSKQNIDDSTLLESNSLWEKGNSKGNFSIPVIPFQYTPFAKRRKGTGYGSPAKTKSRTRCEHPAFRVIEMNITLLF
jgi:hypothetical protein